MYFTDPQETVTESDYSDDPEGEVTFFVERIQGTQGTVEVLWELEPAGRQDLSPTSGTLIFNDVSSITHEKLSGFKLAHLTFH